MTYYAYTKKELPRYGIQEGELALYTGTVNSRQAGTLSPNANSQNVYVYLWRDGQPQELGGQFQSDGEGLDVLRVWTGAEEYTFLRDRPSGYLRQVSGPAKPIVVANLGAIPLRVDTLLEKGRFVVYAGTF